LKGAIKNKSKFYKKKPRTKITNQKNKDQIENPHKSKDNSKVFHGQHEFRGEKRKEEKKSVVSDKSHQYKQPHTSLQKEEDVNVLPTTK
jgi:hypothetical protein